MPKIQKAFHLEITPEQFLNACSPLELQELEMLLQSNRYQQKIRQQEEPIEDPVAELRRENQLKAYEDWKELEADNSWRCDFPASSDGKCLCKDITDCVHNGCITYPKLQPRNQNETRAKTPQSA